jgi:hypothetical protein
MAANEGIFQQPGSLKEHLRHANTETFLHPTHLCQNASQIHRPETPPSWMSYGTLVAKEGCEIEHLTPYTKYVSFSLERRDSFSDLHTLESPLHSLDPLPPSKAGSDPRSTQQRANLPPRDYVMFASNRFIFIRRGVGVIGGVG